MYDEKFEKGLYAIIFISAVLATFGVLWFLRSIGVISL